jgi:phosphoglycerate dehydrogenase-like enzyme
MMWICSGLSVMKNYIAFFHVPITYIPGANSSDSKSLTVWYTLSHMRRMIAARQKVLIGIGRFGVYIHIP